MKRIPLIPNTVKLLAVAILGVAIYSFHQGLIKSRYSPFFTLDLSDESTFFLGWRITQLKNDPQACIKIFQSPLVKARAVRNRDMKNGCGWTNAFAVSSIGGASIPNVTLSCEQTAALAMWVAHAVQPEAKRLFGAKVTSISHVGGYNCRNIKSGIGRYIEVKSEHSFANALDVTGFRLSNGKRISVYSGWKKKGKQSEFLRNIHASACKYFRVALGPGANQAHRDHFHLDRGWLWSCR